MLAPPEALPQVPEVDLSDTDDADDGRHFCIAGRTSLPARDLRDSYFGLSDALLAQIVDDEKSGGISGRRSDPAAAFRYSDASLSDGQLARTADDESYGRNGDGRHFSIAGRTSLPSRDLRDSDFGLSDKQMSRAIDAESQANTWSSTSTPLASARSPVNAPKRELLVHANGASEMDDAKDILLSTRVLSKEFRDSHFGLSDSQMIRLESLPASQPGHTVTAEAPFMVNTYWISPRDGFSPKGLPARDSDFGVSDRQMKGIAAERVLERSGGARGMAPRQPRMSSILVPPMQRVPCPELPKEDRTTSPKALVPTIRGFTNLVASAPASSIVPVSTSTAAHAQASTAYPHVLPGMAVQDSLGPPGAMLNMGQEPGPQTRPDFEAPKRRETCGVCQVIGYDDLCPARNDDKDTESRW